MGLAAVVFAAAMFMVVAMVVAVDLRVKDKAAIQQCLHRRIGRAGHTAVQADARRSQRRLCATANTAADQDVGAQLAQQSGQGAVALPVGAYHTAGSDAAIRHIIELELFGTAKMRENIAIFVSNCDAHIANSFLYGEWCRRCTGIVAQSRPERKTAAARRAAAENEISRF